MYYEEKLIDGALHWRGDPDGEWIAVSVERLSSRVVEAETWRREAARCDEDDLRDLRDQFAAFALAALIQVDFARSISRPNEAAQNAYIFADAALSARGGQDLK